MGLIYLYISKKKSCLSIHLMKNSLQKPAGYGHTHTNTQTQAHTYV